MICYGRVARTCLRPRRALGADHDHVHGVLAGRARLVREVVLLPVRLLLPGRRRRLDLRCDTRILNQPAILLRYARPYQCCLVKVAGAQRLRQTRSEQY